jgi:hypothetical protein
MRGIFNQFMPLNLEARVPGSIFLVVIDIWRVPMTYGVLEHHIARGGFCSTPFLQAKGQLVPQRFVDNCVRKNPDSLSFIVLSEAGFPRNALSLHRSIQVKM